MELELNLQVGFHSSVGLVEVTDGSKYGYGRDYEEAIKDFKKGKEY